MKQSHRLIELCESHMARIIHKIGHLEEGPPLDFRNREELRLLADDLRKAANRFEGETPPTYMVTDFNRTAIYGIGNSRDEAMEEIQEWTNGDCGEMEVHQCTRKLYEKIVDIGGCGIAWEFDDEGVACLRVDVEVARPDESIVNADWPKLNKRNRRESAV